jgi:hypothetical protein
MRWWSGVCTRYKVTFSGERVPFAVVLTGGSNVRLSLAQKSSIL